MTTSGVERKLVAILAADVVGYSRLIGVDEEGTLAPLRELRREVIDPEIVAHRSRIVKTMGDGIISEFASVVDAVRCATGFQGKIAVQIAEQPADRRVAFRVGIHVGDVVVDDSDLLGDGVNVAARLEGMAEAGGICISEDAHRQVRDKMSCKFIDEGERQLKKYNPACARLSLCR